MNQDTHNRNYHDPVMSKEIIEFFRPVATGLIVDATYGGGGHTKALLDEFDAVRVIGIDRDRDAIPRDPLDDRFQFVSGNYANLDECLRGATRAEGRDHGSPPLGILFDLGVSSHQLDDVGRGFTYHRAGPLDMRMGPDAPFTADEVVNTWPQARIVEILRDYGEERFASRIAAAIVKARPIGDTLHLATAVSEAVPAAARRKAHPARRSFQAIRIAVNGELDGVRDGVDAALRIIAPGGRIVVIAYHSLEDRLVKAAFTAAATGCVCPPEFPVCVCGRTAAFRILTRSSVTPTNEEIQRNPRSRSARLRVIEKKVAS